MMHRSRCRVSQLLGVPGILLLAFGGCVQSEAPESVAESPPPAAVAPPAASTLSGNLLAARQGFRTQLQPSSYEPDGPAAEPPEGVFELVHYTAPAGPLVAYVTPDPGDGRRHPTLLWAHGGFGGIGSWFWEDASPRNDQTARAFREAGIVLMVPSWRGENDNPGQFELFFGEVDDLLAAREYLAGLPYVDPDRIYLAGHSTGGTMTLLGVTATDKFRAAFSFGGAPDMQQVVSDGQGYGNTPFDYRSPEEGRLRSAIHFVHAIKTPTFYFEGDTSGYCQDALNMEMQARLLGVPFTACVIRGGDHFDILAPLTGFIAQQILQDTGPECRIAITSQQANEVYEQATAEHRARRLAAVAQFPLIELTPAAAAQIAEIARASSFDLTSTYLRVDRTSGGWQFAFDEAFDPATDERVQQGQLTIVVPKSSLDNVRGHLIDYVDHAGQRGFAFLDRFEE